MHEMGKAYVEELLPDRHAILMQMQGYVASADRWYVFLPVVLATMAGAWLFGGMLAGRYWLPVNLQAALKEYRGTEAYRQEQEARERLRGGDG